MKGIERFLFAGLVLCLAMPLSPALASPIENDSQIDPYELKEKIRHDRTTVDFNVDESVKTVDSHGDPEFHEEQHDLFDAHIDPVAGGDPASNNNGLFYDSSSHSGGGTSFTYTHFLRNPGLSPTERNQIVAFKQDSLIEFALKLDFHDLKDDSLLTVWALPVIDGTAASLNLAMGVKAEDLKDQLLRFNLYDDFGNTTTIASLNALGAIIAASADGGIKIDIGISSGSDLRLESSELELEYVVPEPAVWGLLASLMAIMTLLSRRRRQAI